MKTNYFSDLTNTLLSAKYYNAVILICGLVCYLFLSLFLDKSVSDAVMFDQFNPNADSYSYLQVGEWILRGKETEHVAYRPFLFPMIITSVYTLGGVYLLWIFQIFAYIVGHYYLNKSIEVFTKNRRLAWFGSFLYLINFSLIGLTFHALTEAITVMALSIILYLTVLNNNNKLAAHKYWSWSLLILGLLTLVKPVFIYPFYLCLLLIVLHLLFKKIAFKRLLKWPIALAFVGICVQLFILKSTVGEAGISKVSEKTYKSYLLSQSIMTIENIPMEEARIKVYKMDAKEIANYSIDNIKSIASSFFTNLRTNVQSDSFIQDYNHDEINKTPAKIMQIYNRFSFYIYLSILIFGIYFFLSKMKKTTFFSVLALGLIWVVLLYYVFVTGISFDQRDRLVIGVLPLFIFFFIAFGRLFVLWLNNSFNLKKGRTKPIID